MKIPKILKQQYVANTSWLLAERGLQMAVTLFVGIKLAVYMDEAQWGFYNWASSLVIIFAELARVGLPNITVKFLVQKKFSEDLVMGSSYALKAIGSILAVLLIFTLACILEPSIEGRVLVLFVAFPYLIKSLDVIMYYFEAKVQSKYVVIARSAGIMTNNILKLIVIFGGYNVLWVYPIFTIDALIFVSLLVYFYHKKGQHIRSWKVSKRVGRSLLSNSWPLIFSVMIYSLYMRIDQLMIKEMLGNALNGHYAAANKLSTAWYAVPMLITGSIFPAILKLKEKNYSLFVKRFKTLFEFLILLSISLIIPVSFFSEEIIRVIYSNKYPLAAEVLKIHIWASMFVFVGYAGTKWLIAENMERMSFLFILVGCLVNIVANYFLIKSNGIVGGAWATLLAQFTSYILMPGFIKKTRKLFLTQIQAFVESCTIYLPIRNTWRLLRKL